MKTEFKIILLVFTLCIGVNATAQETALWLRYPAISPNGESILFNYKGGIYSIPTQGGSATPLAVSDSYDYGGVWSHDSSKITFASNRHGNFDVFIMPSSGGNSKRLTYHSNPEIPSDFNKDDTEVVFAARRQDLATNAQYPSRAMSELYRVPISGGKVNQIVTFPAHNARYSSDGKKIIYHDKKGYENNWRKHHKSSVTRDIWMFNLETKKNLKLTSGAEENRNPVFDETEEYFYYLSEISGSFNIHKKALKGSGVSEQITNFKAHPVRFLSRAINGTLCFSYHGEIYILKPGQTAEKVPVSIGAFGWQEKNQIQKVTTGFTESSLSPSGKEFAYIFRGEIFVSSIEYGTTKRVTNSPTMERGVQFSPDGKTLYYASDAGNSWGIYKTSIVREEETLFFNSTLLNESVLINTELSEFQPAISPDGTEVAYLENRTTLKVLNLESNQTRTILPGSFNFSYTDGSIDFQWSPDGRWFLVSYGLENAEIGLIESSGKGTLKNITQSGYEDSGAKWERNGEMMIWRTDKYASMAENGQSSEGDIVGLFFTQQAYDKFNLSKEDFELENKKEENKEKEKTGKPKIKKTKNSKDSNNESKLKTITFDWDSMLDQKKTLTTHRSDAADYTLSKKGDKLYYLTSFKGMSNLWVTDLRTKDTKEFAKIEANRANIELSKEGDFILVLADGSPMKVDVETGSITNISTSGEMVVKQNEERTYMFEHIWKSIKDRFYVKDLHGVDWSFYKAEYQPFLSHINNNYDFSEMLSEMLGELNVSHTGAGTDNSSENNDQTASLGLLYDYSHTGTGLRVSTILKGGPFHKAASKLKIGHVIEKIDGQIINDEIDFYKLLNRKAKKHTLLSLFDPENGKRWDQVVKPISLWRENELLYKRWVNTRREETLRLSDGKVGYVHIPQMNDRGMRKVIDEARGRHGSANALIIDTRFNGGGNLSSKLTAFLIGKQYIVASHRGQNLSFGSSWTKPTVMLVGESNYSDAYNVPRLYRLKNGGQIVGMPVPGTGTGVVWETQIDPSLWFGIPVIGLRVLDEDVYFENHQLEPDIKSQNEPTKLSKGRDQQLEAAVKELMERNQ